MGVFLLANVTQTHGDEVQ